MKFGTVSTGRYTGADRYTGVAVGRRSTVLSYRTFIICSCSITISVASFICHEAVVDLC